MDTNLAIPTGMDSAAVNLARSIRTRESNGKYDTIGDAGTSAGAYQWSNGHEPLTPGQIPKNFQEDAKQYGLDPNDFSPKNQDMVAYRRIKELKDKGKNVLQIASLWNGGDENRYDPNYKTPDGLPSSGDVTINGKVVHYDVPAYVKAVNDYYQKLKEKTGGATPETPAPSTGIQPNPSFTGTNAQGMPNIDLSGGAAGTEGSTPTQFSGSVAGDFGNVAKGVFTGTYNTYKDVTAAIGGDAMAGTFAKLPEADQNYLTTIINQRNAAVQSGDQKLATHFQDLIHNYKTSEGSAITDIFPELNKSNEQVIGDIASMALELSGGADIALGVGTKIGLGAKVTAEEAAALATKKAAMTTGDKALQIAKGVGTQAGFGAAFGAAGAAQNNEDASGVLKSAGVGAALGATTGLATEGISAGLNKAFGAGKTAEELADIAEKDVPKLSAREQKEWYRQQSENTRLSSVDLANKAKAAGEASVKATTEQINELNQKIGASSREEAIKLKQPAQQVMRDASAEYLSLTGEAADGSPALGKKMLHDDLSSAIDSKFEHDPAIGQSLKSDLGLKITPPAVEGQPVPKPAQISNQEILDKARGIMQDVSRTARNGSRVYTPEEYEAMKKYSFLMETLGENGVNMKAANEFWKKWVPVRNRIFTEIKPFDVENTGKIPFANTVTRAASEAKTATKTISKLDAQNFIKELETHMKLPAGSIGKETRELVESLEKAKVSKESAKKIAEEALTKIKADKAEALKTMKLSQYNAESAARRRAILKKIISKVVGAGAGALVGKKFGGTVGEGVGAVVGGSVL